MNIRWFFSKQVRQTSEVCQQVTKLLRHQEDILAPDRKAELETALAKTRQVLAASSDEGELRGAANELEATANKCLRPYPSASTRENIEVFLVAIAVAMAIRTFFLQPFKIPTGSMQPTLYGVTPSPGEDGYDPTLQLPGFFRRVVDGCVYGISYYHVTAKSDGALGRIQPPVSLKLFNLYQKFEVGGETYTIWFPDDDLMERAGLSALGYGGERIPIPHQFKQGEDILRLKVTTGDHLFVNRVSYNFSHPRRGDIVVFETKGIQGLPPDQFYIKRLIGLGGETLRIGADRHVQVNGERLDATTPRFENLYSFNPDKPPAHSVYSGHTPARLLAVGNDFTVRTNHFFVMGDNTVSSSDSRYWGDFSRQNVIGKPCFVYWPMSKRFGWGWR